MPESLKRTGLSVVRQTDFFFLVQCMFPQVGKILLTLQVVHISNATSI